MIICSALLLQHKVITRYILAAMILKFLQSCMYTLTVGSDEQTIILHVLYMFVSVIRTNERCLCKKWR